METGYVLSLCKYIMPTLFVQRVFENTSENILALCQTSLFRTQLKSPRAREQGQLSSSSELKQHLLQAAPCLWALWTPRAKQVPAIPASMASTGPAFWPMPGQTKSHTLFDDMDDVFVAEAAAGTPVVEVYHASRHQRTMCPDYFDEFSPTTSQSGAVPVNGRSSICSPGSGSAWLLSSSVPNSSNSLRSSKHPLSMGKKLLKRINKGLQKFSSIMRRSSSSDCATPIGFQYPSRCSSEHSSEWSSDSTDSSSCRSSIDNSSKASTDEPEGQLQSFSATLGRDWYINYGRTAAAKAVEQLRAAEQAARRAERDAHVAAELSKWRHCDELWLLPGWVGSRRQRACGCQ